MPVSHPRAGAPAQAQTPIQSAAQNVFVSHFPEQSHPTEPAFLQVGSKRSLGPGRAPWPLAPWHAACGKEWLGYTAQSFPAIPASPPECGRRPRLVCLHTPTPTGGVCWPASGQMLSTSLLCFLTCPFFAWSCGFSGCVVRPMVHDAGCARPVSRESPPSGPSLACLCSTSTPYLVLVFILQLSR